MAELDVQSIVEAGLDAVYSAADEEGDTFVNDSTQRTFIHVKNGSASPITVSCDPVVAERDFPGFGEMAKAAVSVVVPAGEDRFIGPFPMVAFGGTPLIEYSAHADVTIAVLRA